MHSPTHYRGNLLDLVLTDAPQIIKNIYIADHDEFVKSDHYAVNFSIDIRGAVKRLKPIKRSARNYTKANWENINDELANVNWTQNIDNTDIDTAWLNFRNILNKICDRHIPNVTIKNNTNYPWYDAEVHKINRKKERLRSRYKLSQNPEHYKKYSQARKQLKNTIKDKMRSKLFDNSNPRVLTKKFWSYVKSSSNSSRIPEHVYYEKVSAANSIKKANLFNDFFFNQFSESSKYDVDVNFSNREFHSFRFNILTVTNILKNIDVNKSPGPDGIAGIVLKKCASNLSYPLSILFDISFSTGQLPSDWKLANVVPVHKKGDKSNVENYRPISLTSLVMKVMEKYLRDELYDKCRQFISDKQHGFLPQKSCTTQLISVLDTMSQSLNNRNDVDVIYFDFTKAFDSVNHDLILHKLKYKFNIDGLMLKFIKGYLHNRAQRVVIDGVFSDTLPVNSGVPQGSILGPLLFVLFINDIYEQVSPGTNIALYADDTKIWRQITSYADCETLNADIKVLEAWALNNKMKFHPKKCKALSISLKHPNYYILPFDRFSYELDNSIIDYHTEETDLGITITSKLNWESHHCNILLKASRQLGLTRRTCHFIKNVAQKRSLYITLVRSIFEHCAEIWGPNAVTAKNKFEPLQKRAVKWILSETNKSYNDNEYYSKLYDLKLLPLQDFFVVKKLKLFYSIVSGTSLIEIPDYVIHKASSRTAHNRYNFAISPELKLPIVRPLGSTVVSHIYTYDRAQNILNFVQQLQKLIL